MFWKVMSFVRNEYSEETCVKEEKGHHKNAHKFNVRIIYFIIYVVFCVVLLGTLNGLE